MRATWFFVVVVLALAQGSMATSDIVCQASGFLIQFGIETSGRSIATILGAVHH